MKVIGKIPNKCYLAFSGGRDSAAALAFLINGRKDVELLHYDHGTEHAVEARKHALEIAGALGLTIHVGSINNFREKKSGESSEEYWRNARYNYFKTFSDAPIITAHHLDDCIETWIFTSLNGNPNIIPYHRADVNIIRPFLAASREEMISFLMKNGSDKLHNWIDDPSNEDVKYMRNLIRKEIVPAALRVNPGLSKVIKKKVLKLASNIKNKPE